MPAVDIIIPAYNAAHFLPAAIESVMAQTFTDWRILLVDDGSRDNTAEVAAAYAARLGPKFEYLYQANAGPSAARNRAVRYSSAPYLALLDADDLWLPARLRLSVAKLEADIGVGLVYGFIQRIDAAGHVLDTFARRNPHGEGRVAPYLYKRSLDLPCPTITFRRDAALAAGLFDETLRASEDRDLWIRIALRYNVALVPEIIAHYRLSPQASTTDPQHMTRGQLYLVNKLYGSPGCGWWARRFALSWIYRQLAEALAGKGDIRQAFKSSLLAVGYFPFQARSLRTSGSLLLRWIGLRRTAA